MDSQINTSDLDKVWDPIDIELLVALRIGLETGKISHDHIDRLVSAGYIESDGRGGYTTTATSSRHIGRIWPSFFLDLSDAKRHSDEQTKEAERARQWVESGHLVVVGGVYRLTDNGNGWLAKEYAYWLKSSGDRCGFRSDIYNYDGVKVGDEYNGVANNSMELERTWKRRRKHILDSLSPDERRLMGLPSPKPLSQDELKVKNILLQYLTKSQVRGSN